MNDDWILTVADLIELLGCSREDILEFLHAGELRAVTTSPLGFAHDEVRRFTEAHLVESLQRGSAPRIAPEFTVSRPRFLGNVVNDAERDH